jgi:hypothetical protein
MAQRRAQTRVNGGKGNDVIVVQSAPLARRSSGGGIRRRRRSGKRSRSRKGSSGGIQTRVQSTFVGGFIYGQFKKNFGGQIPKLVPGLGTAGTVALGIALLKPSNKYLQDMGIAAAAIAGASFGETGTVSGSDDDEDEVLRG